MAIGKPLNKNAYYGAAQSGKNPDIDMTNEFQGPKDGVVSRNLPPAPEPVQEYQQPEPIEEIEQNREIVQPEQQEELPQVQAASVEAKDKDYNFKAIREAKEKAERERDELVKYFMELQKQQVSQQVAPKSSAKSDTSVPAQEQDDFNIDEDSLLDGRYGKKFYNEIKSLKEELRTYKQQSVQQSTEVRIKQQFPDFDQVVSNENISRLKQEFPEIAQTLHDTKDLYSKAVSAYGIIKKFGLYQDPVQVRQQEQVLSNTSKPRPVASLSPQEGESPLQKANIFAQGLTPALKEQLRKEMYEAAKRS